MAWKVTTAPAQEVWTLNEVKNYLKVDTSADDTLITTLLQSAREVAERYLNQALITQTITEKLDRLNHPTIYLSVSPVIAVTSFQYKDNVNSLQTYDAANYVVDTFLKPGRLSLGYGKTWPTLYGNINDVTITYTAGYGTEPSGSIVYNYSNEIQQERRNREVKRKNHSAECYSFCHYKWIWNRDME